VGAQVRSLEKAVRARAVATISVNPKMDLLRRLSTDMGDLKQELDYLGEYVNDYEQSRAICDKDKIGCVEEELFYLGERIRVRQEELKDLQIVHQRVKEKDLDPSGYEFVRYLGIGGMGITLVFYSVTSRRFEVVKVHTGDCMPENLARFEREINALSVIQHDNVARVYGAGMDKKEAKDPPDRVLAETFVSRALQEVESRMKKTVAKLALEDVFPVVGNLFVDPEQDILEFKPEITENDIDPHFASLGEERSKDLKKALRGEWNSLSPSWRKKSVDNIVYRLYQKNKLQQYDFNYYFMELIRGGDLFNEINALSRKRIHMSSWRVFNYLWQILSAIECYSKRMVTKNAFLELGPAGNEWWDSLQEIGLIRGFLTRHGEENAILEADIETILQTIATLSVERPNLLATKDKVMGIFNSLPASIIHRDLKPENILPRKDITRKEIGAVKVIDFGIARALRDNPNERDATRGLTQDGQLLLTQHYGSLEQMAGQEVDIAADLFALAAIAYELLTSNLLFPEDDYAQSMAARMNEAKIRNNVNRAFTYRLQLDGARVEKQVVDQTYYKLISDFSQMMIRMLATYRRAINDPQSRQGVDRPTIDEVKAALEPLMKYATWKAGRRATPD
jgi:serine/threonine protein kinase